MSDKPPVVREWTAEDYLECWTMPAARAEHNALVAAYRAREIWLEDARNEARSRPTRDELAEALEDLSNARRACDEGWQEAQRLEAKLADRDRSLATATADKLHLLNQLAASEVQRERLREALQRFWDVVDLDGCPDEIIFAVEAALAHKES